MEPCVTKIALVTGANKGIGYAIVRNLALRYAQRSSDNPPLTIFLTARDPNRGQESLRKIKQELKSKQILKDENGNVDIKFLRMDLIDEQSIKDVKQILANENGLDILINNAAIASGIGEFDINVVRSTLATNFYGTLNLCNQLYPLIRPNGRLINISSSVGMLKTLSSPELQKEFSREDLDIDELIGLMKKFENDVENNQWIKEGWPSKAYSVSKVGLNAMTKIFARRADSEGKNILVHACCPGWVATDMGGPNAPRNIDQGAETPIYLALDENVVPETKNGEFWRNKQVVPW
ncbi:porcine testicular carbonyl reductase 20beta-Hydroxysteroid dehydrogenase [Rhizophagus irregularis]|uniref:Carbonyl reductase n=3 Tax=Rhizophagus irregularis TaxID=588596 RepID=U9TXF2_RHIID|nr:carbonyl reductase [Rhizophagus irregularis DAOM 181602=DAOM 197198]EXX54534.1 Env9p [Rhizophagus irregularis DAOM 197198w]PKC01748.1 porcine testicular carbonyl reductase 20beta-Hydroxysteroid dehydrogenase [Rhizophagus irregularis]PKC71444.1 porcine testicular carbonyl reductase 20beta-Hydroxysteroid dehydrogenase [Rhizophagus irregularis]PKY25438.1 porcine testicular carbonyl reductase 20beta-Hydroxysteroid dehydrogenase [Rhizophagus irregularis]POG78369.1 carbonyl reductase [Rhizophagus|eukprot:XP_025185235.1 carbonyl reductase [Rhizophagus irregularis DAOM 181602=DAOM 197198]